MGYSVYWHNDRWQGYGVPAYCDYPGCMEEIDRGMGYMSRNDPDASPPNVFLCDNHQHEDLDKFEVESKERPEWIEHITKDKSWLEWRESEPEQFENLLSRLAKTFKD